MATVESILATEWRSLQTADALRSFIATIDGSAATPAGAARAGELSQLREYVARSAASVELNGALYHSVLAFNDLERAVDSYCTLDPLAEALENTLESLRGVQRCEQGA